MMTLLDYNKVRDFFGKDEAGLLVDTIATNGYNDLDDERKKRVCYMYSFIISQRFERLVNLIS